MNITAIANDDPAPSVTGHQQAKPTGITICIASGPPPRKEEDPAAVGADRAWGIAENRLLTETSAASLGQSARPAALAFPGHQPKVSSVKVIR